MADKQISICYLWEGLTADGAQAKGETHARSETIARASLRRQGINVGSLRQKPRTLSPQGRIGSRDIALFSRQLATMMSAGVPLVQACDILGRGHDNPAIQHLLLTIKSDLETGNTLADSLAKHPLHFDKLFCSLVQAGESAGVLETILQRIADYQERTQSLKAKVAKALTYPAAVMLVAMTITTILLIFVVPQFEELFKGFGAELPLFTQQVVNLSRFLHERWYLLLAIVLTLALSWIWLKNHSNSFQILLDKIVLNLPLIGNIQRKACIARIARTLSTLTAAGVPMVGALKSVSGASGNIVFSTAIMLMRNDVATGQSLQHVMQQSRLFPNMVVQMVAIGEESGALDNMLGKVADFYEEEVGNAVDSLSSLLEPAIMLFLGVVVGGLVIAMYLPIFKLGTVI
ncbi:type II secretion system F family protein [Candidatus Methylospira mobilis]|uniref:Type II secretion system F family protein n=1 Tax=Candidatus Methylospira mobilis TaxID=1808979 RepID=A0A5Q0BKJ1_9GAMM|nr:type II secretion system F family protein [Candidatus Methylospira mobilis]QFY44353.1 type II secretion system F family protein [Candidatus Methylospira mobilis]WNV06216.1 type II secretion system F family protein [Candidatus Methylospira mobilis]